MLTDRQQLILRFMAKFWRENHSPPTIRQIQEYTGIKSANGVFSHIKSMAKKGAIVQINGHWMAADTHGSFAGAIDLLRRLERVPLDPALRADIDAFLKVHGDDGTLPAVTREALPSATRERADTQCPATILISAASASPSGKAD